MNDIVIMCSKIQNTRFPCTIDGESYETLTDFIHQISRKSYFPFSTNKSIKEKRDMVYHCTFFSTGCQARLVFNHCTNFLSESYYTFSLQESILQHDNHPLSKHYVEAHRNCYSDCKIKEIKFQTELGVLPGRIRSNLDVECGSNIYYNIRRPILHEQKTEDLDALLDSLEKGTEKRIKVSKPHDILTSITIVDDEIISSNYSQDIVIMDDTMMTNMYGLPLETMVVIDQENHTQLLAYSIIPNKSTISFINFFKDFLELGGSQFRIIIVDRLQSQINAIQEIFPDSKIVYCLVHIRRDLLLHFDENDEIITGFNKANADPSFSFEYLNLLKNRIIKMKKSSEGYKCLLSLINNFDRWLPICLIKIGLYLNWDSSRIEGFFGLLKGNYGHDRGKILTTIKNLNNFGNVLKAQSFASRNKTFKRYSQFSLVPHDKIMLLGKMILQFLETEYAFTIMGTELRSPCVWCELRRNGSKYALPCRHTMHLGYIININIIHKRFLRVDDTQSLPNTITISKEPIPTQKTRNDFLARIDPFVNMYGKNSQVDEILDTCAENLEKLQVHANQGMPPTLAQMGHPFLYPSHNVMAGRQCQKKKHKCSYCNSPGHTKLTCPYLNKI